MIGAEAKKNLLKNEFQNWRLLKGVVMCQQPWAFLFLCQILSYFVSYSCSKTLAYGKKTQFLVKMSLIHMGLYVPVKSWFLFWGIDLEGVKDS